jgi:hypothetical protein
MTEEEPRPVVPTTDPNAAAQPTDTAVSASGATASTESELPEPSDAAVPAEQSLLARLLSLGRDRDDDAGTSQGAASGGSRDQDAGDADASADEVEDDSSFLGAITDAAESAAGTVGKAVTHTTVTIFRGAGSLAVGAGSLAVGAARRFEDRPAARARQAGRTSRDPLPLLWEVHPAANNAARRDLGLLTVPLEQIRGTAVEGAQRGGDFKPIPRLRGTNWQGRWHRIKSAINRLEPLPPVDLLKAGDEYWVLDGHNRVAAALELDQVALDASVLELLLPGLPREDAPTDAGMYLVDAMREVRAAGEGRRSRTAAPSLDLEDTEALRRQFDYDHESKEASE